MTLHRQTRVLHRYLIVATGMVAATAGGAGFPIPSPAATIELHCDQVPPDEKLGIQQNYQGGDCLPGPPGSPGHLVGFAFPFVNSIEEGNIVGVRLFFIDPTVSSMNIYLWSGSHSPRDSCGVELHRLLQAPIQGGGVYSDYVIDPPVPMALGQRIWLGAIYESTTIPPSWALGRINGPSQPGRGFANLSGDHGDWFDLHDFGFGQCFAVRLVLDTNAVAVTEDAAAPSASAHSLAPPVPNPFNLETQMTLVLAEAARVRLIVNDVSGRRVRALEAGPLPAGTHRLVWDGRNDAGKRVTSGTYLLRLEAGARTLIERAVLLH